MKNFEFYSPTKIIFGRGVVSGIGEECLKVGRKALFLYGKDSIKKNGLYKTICESLSLAGVEWVELSGVQPNPILTHAEAGGKIARNEKVDFILAVGGGSVIDEAKAIADASCTDIPLWDFYEKKAQVERAIPIVAVQTLPATSSETNQAGVLTNENTNEKFGLRSPLFVPVKAFLDPELTFSIPPKYTAYACFDIMCHMMEGYFTMTESFVPVHEGFVEGLVKAVMKSLERILIDPTDYDARASVMWAGALAWNGMANAGLEGAAIPCHMIEHPLSAVYDISHGAGLSIIYPAWLKHQKEVITDRILKFGEKILEMKDLNRHSSLEACDLVIHQFEEWISSVGCPHSLSQIGVINPDIDELVTQTLKLGQYWGITDYSSDDIESILQNCL